MDSGRDVALDVHLEGEKDRDNEVVRTEAAKPSPASGDTAYGRRRSKRRVERSLLTADPAPDTEGCVRVLRTRGSQTSGINGSDRVGLQTTPLPRRGRGKSTKSQSEKETATFSTMKRSNSRRASKSTLGPKLSKSRKDNWRPSARGRNLPPAQTCKLEARVVAMSCEEEDKISKGGDNIADQAEAHSEDPPVRDDPNGIIDKPQLKMKLACLQVLQQKGVKTEESEKEDDENDVKNKSPLKVMVRSEDEVQDNATTYSKRGRQQKVEKPARTPKCRKKPPVQYVRCEMEGCGTVLAHPRYLQHHIKYQHLLKKKYVCDHPSCGRLFRLQKQLLRHAKHHTDQRDYICEYCARAFKSSHNLAVHRMIHTGEKPIQCEICGFTCRQKASLNWHMKKHDAESSYQFSCSICGKKFEKKDSIVAHKAKSHPEVLIAEAIAANGGPIIKSTDVAPEAALESVPEIMPALISPTQPRVSQEDQEVLTLTPLQQVVLPLASDTALGESESHFPQIPSETPAMLHLATPSAGHFPSTSHSPLIQLSALPSSSTVTPVSSALSQSPLINLSPAFTIAPQQTIEWEMEDKDTQLTGDGEIWNKVVEGTAPQDVGNIIWESNREIKREDEGIVWEAEGLRPVLLH